MDSILASLNASTQQGALEMATLKEGQKERVGETFEEMVAKYGEEKAWNAYLTCDYKKQETPV